ncbi:MAG: Asp-tRNA(Asn)/Glu-tRNA(Gln) amidotransferase subunit GatC [Pyrinomonadaceae bacterium]|nr:Asp-tRNA(Asn)/Glu-tRNA(Gln) amidotransferase subunit GatC [Pyrinomonadaceae bacterium]
MITETEIRKIAQLAHLEINDAEVKLYAGQMSNIVAYIEQLNELDISKLDAATGGLTLESDGMLVRRDDIPHESLGQETALNSAPDAASGHFRVPKVL